MNYAFANSFMNLCKGDLGEQAHDLENTLALHGTAILSRFPISSLRTQVLPVEKDFFEAQEKRLGRRRGLICGIEVDGHSVDLAAVHLELNSSPQHRARQLQAVVSHVESSGSRAKLIGGDFNTTTYNLHNAITCGGSLFYKVFIFGIESTIKHYMTPEKKFERPLFTMLRQHQFEVDSYNDRNKGTFYYDLKDRVTAAKTANFVPAISLRWLEHKLRPWNGRVPLRLDWFTGKGFQPQAPKVIERPMFENKLVSDHDPIVIDLVVP
jgi:endonuclease/exonuclease/phosphatase family metal-dependent hydrolase